MSSSEDEYVAKRQGRRSRATEPELPDAVKRQDLSVDIIQQQQAMLQRLKEENRRLMEEQADAMHTSILETLKLQAQAIANSSRTSKKAKKTKPKRVRAATPTRKKRPVKPVRRVSRQPSRPVSRESVRSGYSYESGSESEASHRSVSRSIRSTRSKASSRSRVSYSSRVSGHTQRPRLQQQVRSSARLRTQPRRAPARGRNYGLGSARSRGSMSTARSNYDTYAPKRRPSVSDRNMSRSPIRGARDGPRSVRRAGRQRSIEHPSLMQSPLASDTVANRGRHTMRMMKDPSGYERRPEAGRRRVGSVTRNRSTSVTRRSGNMSQRGLPGRREERLTAVRRSARRESYRQYRPSHSDAEFDSMPAKGRRARDYGRRMPSLNSGRQPGSPGSPDSVVSTGSTARSRHMQALYGRRGGARRASSSTQGGSPMTSRSQTFSRLPQPASAMDRHGGMAPAASVDVLPQRGRRQVSHSERQRGRVSKARRSGLTGSHYSGRGSGYDSVTAQLLAKSQLMVDEVKRSSLRGSRRNTETSLAEEGYNEFENPEDEGHGTPDGSPSASQAELGFADATTGKKVSRRESKKLRKRNQPDGTGVPPSDTTPNPSVDGGPSMESHLAPYEEWSADAGADESVPPQPRSDKVVHRPKGSRIPPPPPPGLPPSQRSSSDVESPYANDVPHPANGTLPRPLRAPPSSGSARSEASGPATPIQQRGGKKEAEAAETLSSPSTNTQPPANGAVQQQSTATPEKRGSGVSLPPAFSTSQPSQRSTGRPEKSSAVSPLDAKLTHEEWENEVARNILAIYRADASRYHQADSTVERESPLLTEAPRRAPTKKVSPLPSPSKTKKEVWPGGSGGAKGVARLRGGPHPIWFGGGGGMVSNRAVWCGLVTDETERNPLTAQQQAASIAAGGCIHRLCHELQGLERAGRYTTYVSMLEQLLLPKLHHPKSREVASRQWRQFIVIINIFGVKYTEQDQFGKALELLRKADSCIAEDDRMAPNVRKELTAFVMDSYAFYYFRRGKYQAALQCAHKALRTHTSLQQWDHVAKCHLHTAVILSKLRKHAEAIRCLGHVLQLVDEERLETGGASAQKICMVAVCYHNVAVEHLALHQPQEACVDSQNARRLARLSLSYSNRYLRHFETTHAAALEALSLSKPVKSVLKDAEVDQKQTVKRLAEDLFD